MATVSSDTQSAPPFILTGPSLRRRLLSPANLLAIAIALSLVYFLVARFDFDLGGTWARIVENNLGWYILAFASYYLTFPLRALRWRLLLEDSGCEVRARSIPLLQLTEISFLGWFVNTITILRMGFLYRCHQLSQRLNTSFARVAGGLFAERILDTVLTFGLLAVAALGLLSTQTDGLVGSVLLGALVASLVLSGAALALIVAGVSPQRIIPSRFRPGYGNFRQATLKSFHRWPWLMALSLGIWVCESARLLFVIHALGLSVELPLVLFVALSASLIISFAITPGGVGLVEVGMTVLLATALTQEEAVSVALLDRSISYVSVVILGGALFLARTLPGLGPKPAGAGRSQSAERP